MIPVLLVSLALFALGLMFVIEVLRLRANSRQRVRMQHRRPRRQPVLEDRLHDAFAGPRAQFGEIFVNYAVWKRENETRLELFSGAPWLGLNVFTRSLIVRHLWRALEALAHGSVVIVDQPRQQWTQKIDAAFDDRGVDPWGPRPSFGIDGPQFAKD